MQNFFEKPEIKTNMTDTKITEQIQKGSHGWIQWKGTNVCCDIHCKCGHHSHIDAEFAYYVQCSNCKTYYEMNGHIELIELKERPDSTCIEIST